ncbi:MAG TPA: hypothetical protein VKV69_00535 [Actinomycetota bacterium]|nr:hypothetical protein [Actinomycetota bacterium]
MRAHVDERLRYYATAVQQLRARRSGPSARGAMEEKSLIEQMRGCAEVLAIIEGAETDSIIELYLDQAARDPWKPPETH